MLSVVGEADNVLHTLQLAFRLQPHVVLLEASMPMISGFQATRVLKQELPRVHVILMSAIYSHAEAAPEAKRCGASLFWDKTSNVFTDLIPVIRQLCRPQGQEIHKRSTPRRRAMPRSKATETLSPKG
jgi:DNA-binding NarL/FixJ family response regulator